MSRNFENQLLFDPKFSIGDQFDFDKRRPASSLYPPYPVPISCYTDCLQFPLCYKLITNFKQIWRIYKMFKLGT